MKDARLVLLNSNDRIKNQRQSQNGWVGDLINCGPRGTYENVLKFVFALALPLLNVNFVMRDGPQVLAKLFLIDYSFTQTLCVCMAENPRKSFTHAGLNVMHIHAHFTSTTKFTFMI